MTKSERYRYYASREWALLKQRVRERSGGMCERCRERDYEQTHHLTYERLGRERLEDLQGLCAPCHEYVSGMRAEDPSAQPFRPVYSREEDLVRRRIEAKFLSCLHNCSDETRERFAIWWDRHNGASYGSYIRHSYHFDGLTFCMLGWGWSSGELDAEQSATLHEVQKCRHIPSDYPMEWEYYDLVRLDAEKEILLIESCRPPRAESLASLYRRFISEIDGVRSEKRDPNYEILRLLFDELISGIRVLDVEFLYVDAGDDDGGDDGE